MRSGVLLRVSFDILCPRMDDIYKMKMLLKSSSILNNSLILQKANNPAIVCLNKEDSLKLLQTLKKDNWEKKNNN